MPWELDSESAHTKQTYNWFRICTGLKVKMIPLNVYTSWMKRRDISGALSFGIIILAGWTLIECKLQNNYFINVSHLSLLKVIKKFRRIHEFWQTSMYAIFLTRVIVFFNSRCFVDTLKPVGTADRRFAHNPQWFWHYTVDVFKCFEYNFHKSNRPVIS